MPFPVLDDYLKRLSEPSAVQSSVALNPDGQAQARFFNCTLTTVFQPIVAVGAPGLTGFEALARGGPESGAGLPVWRMLENAASDDESIELDRLCRMLHAINFFRQPDAEGTDLYLNVHDRLLGAVSSNHGYAFRRILNALGLPLARIVLQLPAASPSRRWLVSYVADNYRRNGFRLALNTGGADEARQVLALVRPDVIKVDADAFPDAAALEDMLLLAQAHSAKLVVKRVDSVSTLSMLERASANSGVTGYAQGELLGSPHAELGVWSACLAA
jgi:EAL domain-containing protein (putative c-di-GMP-specific phosphodiesterase class I)